MSNAETKEKIKKTFRTLLVQRPFSRIRVSDIIEQAEISRMTFYRHYEDKYALLEDVCYDDFVCFAPIYGKNAYWKDITVCILHSMANNRPFYLRALQEDESAETLMHALERVSSTFTGGTATRTTYAAWKIVLRDWARGGLVEAPEKVYRALILNFPVCEVISSEKWDMSICEYERRTLSDFKKLKEQESEQPAD